MKKATPPKTPQPRPARFGVYLDVETRNALHRAAIDEGTKATRIVERLIKNYLRDRGSRG